MVLLRTAAVASLAAFTTALNLPTSHVKRQASQLNDQYDFVVVGGGTTGLTVADRLSAAFPASMTFLRTATLDLH